MKLLHCLECNDIVRLTREPRTCGCGAAEGYYLPDGLHVEYSGLARILGMLNGEWRMSLLFPPERPFEQDFKWFVIGHWPGCHLNKTDEPTKYNEWPGSAGADFAAGTPCS